MSACLISGCSGGGSDGNSSGISFNGSTTPAAIDATNAEAIGTASGEAIRVANSSAGLPTGITTNSTTSDNLTEINNIVISQLNVLTLPAAVDVSGQICSSGIADATDPGNATSGPVDITVTFNNCVLIDAPMTVSGTAKIHFDDTANIDASFPITYTNFKVTDNNGTTMINLSMVCVFGLSCTFNSDYVSADGTVHHVSEFNLLGFNSPQLAANTQVGLHKR